MSAADSSCASSISATSAESAPLVEDLPTQAPLRAKQVHTIVVTDSLVNDCAGSSEEVAPQENPLPVVSGYDILEILGRGGMGVVYKARHQTLKRLVALKMIVAGAHAGPDQVARFRAEAEAVARLQHPNIVQIYEIGEQDGLPFIALEFVDGVSLAHKLAGTPQPPRAAAELALILARAVHQAHQAGIVHRDLKPANVLLTKAGSSKITDFGLAKQLDTPSGQTQSGAIIGTPSYMAPEQAGGKNKEVGPLADVYALGAILYEMLSGRPPFKADTSIDTLMQVISEEPVPPSRLNRKVPRDLETITLKCLRKESANRYPSAFDLANDLRRYLAGEPINARPVGTLERSWRWCRRNPSFAGLLAAVVAIVLVGSVVAWEANGRLRAQMLRDRLLESTTADVPGIVKDMAPYRRWIDPLLTEAYSQTASDGDRRKQLHVSLALLPVDDRQVEYLHGRLLGAEAHEIAVIVAELRPHHAGLVERWWNILEDRRMSQDHRFRAACALATYAPDDNRWEGVSDDVCARLLQQDTLSMGTWVKALQPAARFMLKSLASLLGDDERNSAGLNLIASLYTSFARGVSSAFARLENMLAEEGDPGELNEAKFARIKRKTNAGAALVSMGRGEKVWPLLKHSPDPTFRSLLTFRLARGGADFKVLLARFEDEKEISIKRAILLSLGEFGLDRLSKVERRIHVEPLLVRLWRDDPDPGIHSACEWLLRRWQAEGQLKEILRELVTEDVRGDRQWYINREGQTMMVIAKPIEFWMGEGKDRIRKQIAQGFAICSKEVTGEQFKRFRPSYAHQHIRHHSKFWDGPTDDVSWYEAAAYCNWLSAKEGIPKEQWCYSPNKKGEYAAGMEFVPNALQRWGYRLPTESEWEYACRADAETQFSFGESDELRGSFGWFAVGALQSVGKLKPNDLGLFDMHGNAAEWTHDVVHDEKVEKRAVRGGSINRGPEYGRSSSRNLGDPGGSRNGFRVARTIP